MSLCRAGTCLVLRHFGASSLAADGLGLRELRSADDTIVRFADQLGANARVVFHLSLDDRLLKDYVGTLSQLLSRLQVPQDEKISSPLVTRAIANAQEKKGL